MESGSNTYLRNKANHGSYGFWLGGSDQTVLIGNEAGFNGQVGCGRTMPRSRAFGHGGIVIVGGPSSHALLSGNWCHDNNGGGIVFRAGRGLVRGARWRTRHSGGPAKPAFGAATAGLSGAGGGDDIWLGFYNLEALGEHGGGLLRRCDRPAPRQARRTLPFNGLRRWPNCSARRAPSPSEAVRFDARASQDPDGRPLHFHWTMETQTGDQAVFNPVFTKPGFYRLGLTVDNGTLASIGWRDLVVSARRSPNCSAPRAALARWGFELRETMMDAAG